MGNIKNILNFIKLIPKNNSPNKFIVIGADILTTLNKNHHKTKLGKILIIPLINKIFRVKNRS